jgi:Rod binding domain-containing protein
MVGGVELSLVARMPEPQRTAEAAKHFEALLVEHLLRTMREATRSEDPTLTGTDTYLDLADQQLARALAERGGLGIARMVLKHLHQPGSPVDKAREDV